MKALVISAGSSKNSYSAGVLKHLLGDLNIQYDAIFGVSSGAIIAAFLGMYKHGEEKKSAIDLEKWWMQIDKTKVYRHWKFFGMLSVLWKPALFDSTPLQNMIKKTLDLKKIRASGKVVGVGCLSLNTGKYNTFLQSHDEFINATIASCAYSGAFLPVKFKSGLNEYEEDWSDGGSKAYSPTQAVCDIGATDITVIHSSPEERDYLKLDKLNILNILQRSFDASLEKISTNDLSKLEMNNQLALAGVGTKKFIPYTIYRPKHNLTNNSLDFSPAKIREMFNLGYEDAVNITNNKV